MMGKTNIPSQSVSSNQPTPQEPLRGKSLEEKPIAIKNKDDTKKIRAKSSSDPKEK
jgi:hypothetical protein